MALTFHYKIEAAAHAKAKPAGYTQADLDAAHIYVAEDKPEDGKA